MAPRIRTGRPRCVTGPVDDPRRQLALLLDRAHIAEHLLSNSRPLPQVKFGVLFADDRCANIFEALVGTLRAAKKRKMIHFEGEMLLQGAHDNVDVVLLSED